MFAWVVATALLVGVVAFEVLLFRYVGSGPMSASGSTRSARTIKVDPPEASDGAGGADATAGAARDALPADADALGCPDCGAVNDDDPMVRYCWHCLSQLY